MSNPTPNLYALLVGVSQYDHVRNLRGTNDAESMAELLRDNIIDSQFGKVEIKSLLSPVGTEPDPKTKATKANVVREFKDHLGKAQAGDTVLFFFAGHGVREETTVKSFADSQSDGNIAGLVFQDTDLKNQDKPETNTLSDKELRYLIRELAEDKNGNPKAHVVTIFDCCHSGGNTRSSLEEELPATSRQVQRGAFGPRTWEGFIFHKDQDLKSKAEQGIDIDEVLPMGDHVMLAACREVELAWEKGGQGNFTRALIKAIRASDGQISYHEIQSRLLNQMRAQYLDSDGRHDMRQTPQMYLQTPDRASRYNLFLSNRADEVPTTGNITRIKKEDDRYRLDIGALHGVPVDSRKPIQVALYEDKTAMNAKATIKTVFPSYCDLEMPAGFSRAYKETVNYKGEIKGLGIPLMKVFLKAADASQQKGVDTAKATIEKALEKVKSQSLELISEEENADYTVYVVDGTYRIVEPFDYKRARVMPLPYEKDDVTGELYAQLLQIAKWKFLKGLERKGVFLNNRGRVQAGYPIEVKAYQLIPGATEEQLLKPNGNTYTLDLSQSSQKKVKLRLEIINHAPEQMQVGIAYMDHLFGFDAEIDSKGGPTLFKRNMSSNPTLLSPKGGVGSILETRGKVDDATGFRYSTMVSGAYIETDNWEGREDSIKLIVSEESFDIQNFHMDSLPAPSDDPSDRDRNALVQDEDEDDEPSPPAWEIQTFNFFITNPDYDPDLG